MKRGDNGFKNGINTLGHNWLGIFVLLSIAALVCIIAAMVQNDFRFVERGKIMKFVVMKYRVLHKFL